MFSSSSGKCMKWRSGRVLVAGSLGAALLIGGCGSTEPKSGEQQDVKAAPGEVKLFFTEGEQFRPVEREVEQSAPTPVDATEALLEGPGKIEPAAAAGDDAVTLIPPGTRVKGVHLDGSGEATVDLSAKFLGEIPPRASQRNRAENDEVNGRLGQITYTLTSLAKVDSVKVRSGGITVEAPENRSSGGAAAGRIEQDRGNYSAPPKTPAAPKVRGGGGGIEPGTLSLQRRLARLGYLPSGGVDGIAGYQTEQAVMAFQAWEGLDRDGDAGPKTRAALRRARRPKPSVRRPGRFMEVRLGKGVLLLVKGRRVRRAIHVSGGAPGYETPTGRYRVFRKELMSWSYPFSTWLPYASYFNNGIAFHEYPEVPPYPASHGCVRVPTPDAKRVYRFARMNTVVVVRS